MRVSLGKRLHHFCHKNIHVIAKKKTAFHLANVTDRMSRGRMSPGGCHWANGRAVLANECIYYTVKKHGIPLDGRCCPEVIGWALGGRVVLAHEYIHYRANKTWHHPPRPLLWSPSLGPRDLKSPPNKNIKAACLL